MTAGIPPPIPPSGGASGSAVPSKALVLGAALAAGGLFGLFQLRLLPKAWGPWVSKLYFWPTLPFTMIRAFDNYWTKMDGEQRTVKYGLYTSIVWHAHIRTTYVSGTRMLWCECGQVRANTFREL